MKSSFVSCCLFSVACLISVAYAQELHQNSSSLTKGSAMGAWDAGIFANDVALDFLNELDAIDVLPSLAAAVALPNGEYIEEDAGIRALVAAQLIATAKDGIEDRLPEAARRIVSRMGRPPSKEMVAAAKIATLSVLTSSETKELRSELGSEEFKKWQNEIKSVLARLN